MVFGSVERRVKAVLGPNGHRRGGRRQKKRNRGGNEHLLLNAWCLFPSHILI